MILLRLVVCIHMPSFKWFCWVMLKICLTLRLAAMLLAFVLRHHYLICILQKNPNNSRTKINRKKRFTPSFLIFSDLSNKTKFILEVRCTLKAFQGCLKWRHCWRSKRAWSERAKKQFWNQKLPQCILILTTMHRFAQLETMSDCCTASLGNLSSDNGLRLPLKNNHFCNE